MRTPTVTIPALDTIDDAKVKAAAAKVADLEGRGRDADQAVDQARSAVKRAREQDVQALADALDAGRHDPGRQAEPAAEQALEECERMAAALDVALRRASTDFEAVVEARRDPWRQKIEQRRAARLERIRAACDALADELDGLGADNGLLGYLARFPDGAKLSTGSPRLLALPGPNGDPYGALAAVDALRALADPPAPPEPPAVRVADPPRGLVEA